MTRDDKLCNKSIKKKHIWQFLRFAVVAGDKKFEALNDRSLLPSHVDLTSLVSEESCKKKGVPMGLHFPGAVTPTRQIFSTFCNSVACRRIVA